MNVGSKYKFSCQGSYLLYTYVIAVSWPGLYSLLLLSALFVSPVLETVVVVFFFFFGIQMGAHT